MAKLIVYTVDLPGDDSHKRGDVISVLDDHRPVGGDVEFGVLQKDGSRKFLWRVVSVPGSAGQYADLEKCPIRPDGDVSKTYPMRSKRVDLDLVEGAASGMKGSSLSPGELISATKAGIDAVTVDIAPKDTGVVLPPEVKTDGD